mmetsp:Transcript_72259/g.200439  ORF Transcript_72259/g.200439 Transcript_72259/m.200439 type:complete len:215 (+) Transcript_72259:594-1238(+)
MSSMGRESHSTEGLLESDAASVTGETPSLSNKLYSFGSSKRLNLEALGVDESLSKETPRPHFPSDSDFGRSTEANTGSAATPLTGMASALLISEGGPPKRPKPVDGRFCFSASAVPRPHPRANREGGPPPRPHRNCAGPLSSAVAGGLSPFALSLSACGLSSGDFETFVPLTKPSMSSCSSSMSSDTEGNWPTLAPTLSMANCSSSCMNPAWSK